MFVAASVRRQRRDSSFGCERRELLRGSCRSLFRAVFRTALFTIRHALRIERAAYRVVANARKVLNPATADQYDRVFLEVMADAWNVGGDFESVGQTNAANLAERGVRFLRSRGVNAGADTTALWAALEGWRFRLPSLVRASLTDQLIDRWHEMRFYLSSKIPADNSCKTIPHELLTACITGERKVRLEKAASPTSARELGSLANGRLQSWIGQGASKLVAAGQSGQGRSGRKSKRITRGPRRPNPGLEGGAGWDCPQLPDGDQALRR